MKLQLPSTSGAKELTVRLALEERDEDDAGGGLVRVEGLTGDNDGAWDANEMSGVGVWCRECEAVLVSVDRITEWRDLPSENWADMMDLWHCHKPHDENEHSIPEEQEENSSKGYAATTSLVVSSGVGFVGPSYFLVARADCTNVKVSYY